MCKASRYCEKLKNISNDFKKERGELVEMLSKTDREINKFYHDLEIKAFNACEGYYLSARLQKLLRQRRIIKQELYKLRALSSAFNFDKANKWLDSAQKGLNKIEKDTKDNHMHDWDIDIEEIKQKFLQGV